MRFFFVLILSLQLINPTIAWSDDLSYYVKKVDNPPVIDGKVGLDEWNTDQKYITHTVSALYLNGIKNTDIGVVMLRDINYLYIKLDILDNVSEYFSIGISFTQKSPTRMDESYDNKISYYNSTDLILYDLYNCLNVMEYSACGTKELLPGMNDTSVEFDVKMVNQSSIVSFEYKIPIIEKDTDEDIAIKHGIYISFIVNPFGNIFEIGHGGASSPPLRVVYAKPILSNQIANTVAMVLLIIVSILLFKKYLIPPSDS